MSDVMLANIVFDEKKALLEIKNGKTLKEFGIIDPESGRSLPTRLMVLATLTYHKDNGYLEIPEKDWTGRAAFLAVEKNFRSLTVIPEKYLSFVTDAVIEQSTRLTRSNLHDFMNILNTLPEGFLHRLRLSSEPISRFFTKENLERTQNKGADQNREKKKNKEFLPERKKEHFLMDFSSAPDFSDPDEPSASVFLSLPAKEQTLERLEGIIQAEEDLPGDFIKRLTIPNRNAFFYEKNQDLKRAAYWKERILPYLNRNICDRIARTHPEGSLETPAYLTKEAVLEFWNRKRDHSSKQEMTDWFLKFPQEMLDPSMTEDILATAEVLAHAPNILKNDQKMIMRFLSKTPYKILDLPEYQTPGRLLVNGVPLTRITIGKIKDGEFRELVALALDIPYTPATRN